MQLSTLSTSYRFDYRSPEPSIDIIKSNLKHLNIRPKDVDDICKDAQNAYKMVFEQVLLIMRYVRCLMRDKQNSLAISGRMRLLLNIFDSHEDFDHEDFDREELEKIQKGILQNLENNVGSNDVIAYLQSLGSNESVFILSKMQATGVAFAPITYINNGKAIYKPYTYYDMYMCLHHPLEIFQKLLSQKPHDEYKIERLIYDNIKDSANRINPKGSAHAMAWYKTMPEEQKQRIFKLSNENNFAQIIKDYKPTNKDIVLREIRSKLAIELGEWASDIFAQISNPSYSKIAASKSWKKQLVFNEYFDISHESASTIISLNSGLVKNLHKLNQLDDLFDSLKLALKAKLNSQTGGRAWVKEKSINNRDALSNISDWYDRYSTGMLKKIDQIPKAIISIVCFDLENGYPSLKNAFHYAHILKEAYSKSQEKTAEKRASPIKERNLILTYIISLNLYLSNHKNNSLDDLVRKIECNDTQNINNLNTLSNPIMSSWTIFTPNEDGSLNADFDTDKQDKMMYRFKTIPVFFKKNMEEELGDVSQMISNQYDTENPESFPYSSAFPWPLWIHKSQVEDVDSVED